MGRRWIEKLEDLADLVYGRWYRVRVVDVRKDRARKQIVVKIEHTDREQEGRMTHMTIALPLRRVGLGAAFSEACGLLDGSSTGISPRDAVGCVVQVRYENIESEGVRVVAVRRVAAEVPK